MSEKQDYQELSPEKFAEFIMSYTEEVPPQEAKESPYDTELKSIRPEIIKLINKHKQGVVLDIGCGKGIILNCLAEIEMFKEDEWRYCGVDLPEYRKELLYLAVDKELNSKTSFSPLELFYKEWIPDKEPRPLVVVIRNVFHELNIDQTAELVHALANNLTKEDHLIIQDIQVFPKMERHNCCWLPELFEELLKNYGFQGNLWSETTRRGNRWFNYTGVLKEPTYPSYENIKETVINIKQVQLDYMRRVKDSNPKGWQGRHQLISIIDFDLQKSALDQQLYEAKETETKPQTLILPPAYKKWLNRKCLEMEIGQLIGNSEEKDVFTFISMPRIFISLYAFPPARKERAEQKEQKPEDIEQLIPAHNCLVIEGQAGSGKTTLLKHFAHSVIHEKEHPLTHYLPVLVFLNDLQTIVKGVKKTICGTPFVEDFLTKYFQETDNGLSWELLERYSEAGKLLLLLDGLDEMEKDARGMVVSSLAHFKDKYSVKLVLTGRPTGIDEKVRQSFSGRLIKIEDLDKDQKNDFINKWLHYDKKLQDKGVTSRQILDKLKTHEHLDKLTLPYTRK